MTLTKTADRLIIDFTGTSPQAKGPINHAGNYADGVFLKKWLETTGGGGRGDPLARELELVALDVLQGKVSERSARENYGVVLRIEAEDVRVDAEATAALRARLRAERGPALFFDRGPGYKLLSGRDHADVDFV